MAQPKLVVRVDPAAALRLSRDDFSVRVESPEDPIFWIRIERDSSDVVVVTDFNPGGHTVEELEAGLLMAIRAVAPPRLDTLVFKDLIPGGDQQPGFPIKLVRTADLAKTLAKAVADRLGRKVTGFRIEPRGGKLDAILSLGRS